MMQPVIMPVLDMTMERGIILRWLKRQGDQVRAGEPLFEVQTDKADIEVEAPVDGVLARIVYPEGAEVPVREVVAYIAAPGEEFDAVPQVASPSGTASEPSEAFGSAVAAEPAPLSAARSAGSGSPQQGRIRATPAARRRARELGIDLSRVAGTGRSGVIRVADVEAAAGVTSGASEEPHAQTVDGRHVASPPAPRVPSVVHPFNTTGGMNDDGLERVPVRGNRKAVAERMAESARIPQVTLYARANAVPIQDFRRQFGPAVTEATGHPLSYTAVLAFVVARTLPRFPYLNAHWREGEIWRFRSVHLGIAVALPEGGLVVPVIRDAEKRSLAELAQAVADVSARAREGRLRSDEFGGGTFTISNLGMFGVEYFNALLNPPQVGILSVGAITQQPVEDAGHLTLRPCITLGLTFDHRAVDGADAAKYLRHLVEALEDPWRLLI
ncbi:MAG: hypothetical protein DIU69_05910 [Bacillota bacterium]|nr:MAG: hypothetical protein DIU69_05910 [Bacillota bacterium]